MIGQDLIFNFGKGTYSKCWISWNLIQIQEWSSIVRKF